MGKKNLGLTLMAALLVDLLSAQQAAANVQCAPASRTVHAGESIQAAINAVASAGGGVVQIEGGTYPVTPGSPLQLKSNVTLCANGTNGNTIIQLPPDQPGHLLLIGDSSANVRAQNAAVYNVVFDNGIVSIFGDQVTIQSNTFQNIQVQNVGGSAWGGFGASRSTGLFVLDNKFNNLANGGMTFWNTTGVTIQRNAFSSVSQGISFTAQAGTDGPAIATSNVTISTNTMAGLSRMGIEIMGDPGVQGANVFVQNNRMANWVAGSIAPIAMSIVRGLSATITGNTAICGAGCTGWILPLVDDDPNYPYSRHQPDNRHCDEPSPAGQAITWKNVKPSMGLELSGTGTTKVSGNTVQGFRSGITIQSPNDTVNVSNNAIYGAVHGIDKPAADNASYGLVVANILNNQIENPRATGIDGEWAYTASVKISGNLITREAGKWGADNQCAFRAIAVSPQGSNATPMVLDGNRILFEGVPPSGFSATGIKFYGALSGLAIKNNWILSTTSPAFGSGLQVASSGATYGVKLNTNTLQNLSAVSTGTVENSYDATSSDNLAINMVGGGKFTAKTVSFVPDVSIKPSSASGPAPLPFDWSEPTAWTFLNAPIWYAGNGDSAAASGLKGQYLLAANRTVRVLQRSTSGVISVNKALVTQP